MGSARLGPRDAGDLEGPFDGAGFQDAGGTVAHRSGLATNCGIGFLLLSGPAAPRSAAAAGRPGHRGAPRAAPSPPARNAPAACARTCCRACCCGPAAAGRRSTARATSGPVRPRSRARPRRPARSASYSPTLRSSSSPASRRSATKPRLRGDSRFSASSRISGSLSGSLCWPCGAAIPRSSRSARSWWTKRWHASAQASASFQSFLSRLTYLGGISRGRAWRLRCRRRTTRPAASKPTQGGWSSCRGQGRGWLTGAWIFSYYILIIYYN